MAISWRWAVKTYLATREAYSNQAQFIAGTEFGLEVYWGIHVVDSLEGV